MFILITLNILIHKFLPVFQPNGQDPISSTDKGFTPAVRASYVQEDWFSPPRRLRIDEIPQIIEDFRLSARNAIEAGKSILH